MTINQLIDQLQEIKLVINTTPFDKNKFFVLCKGLNDFGLDVDKDQFVYITKMETEEDDILYSDYQ